MITAASSGGCGDLVYSIPVMKKMGVTHVYVKESWYKHPHHSLYSVMKNLLEMQGFEVFPIAGGYDPMVYEPGLQVDFDMDRFRLIKGAGQKHIMVRMFQAFDLTANNWNRPWLNVSGFPENEPDVEYSLIHLTPRWRDNSRVNWKKVVRSIRGKVYFIGFQEEHASFCQQADCIEYFPTDNILQMAQLIRDCRALYCNQSVGLTLAQGLGKPYFLELKPGKSNTRMYTKNENILQ